MIPTDIQWHLLTLYTLLFDDKNQIECAIKVLLLGYFSWEKLLRFLIARGKKMNSGLFYPRRDNLAIVTHGRKN